MKNTFADSYTKYLAQKKIYHSLKNKLKRTYLHRSTAWGEYHKLTSVLTFKLWQYYNYLKKNLLKPTFVFPFKLVLIFCYIIIIVCFYFLYKLVYFLTYFFQKPLQLPSSCAALNGVSFIIPTWNKAKLVTACVKKLTAVLESENPQIQKEIIIVNNGSTDKTVKSIESITSSIPIRLVNLPQNLGFSPAINLGVGLAKYNYIYLLNNDMIPKPNFFLSIINFAQSKIDKHSWFFGISSQVFFFDKAKRREESGKTYIFPFFGIIQAAHIVNHQNLSEPSLTCYPGGGSSLINKHLFNLLGGYDYQTYRPGYCEDLDLGFLAWRFSYPSYFVPKSHIIHHHQSSYKKITADPTHYLFKNYIAFTLKNISNFSLFLNHIISFSLYALVDKKHFNYILEIIPILPSIFASKISLLKYRSQFKDSDLFDFIRFEISHAQD